MKSVLNASVQKLYKVFNLMYYVTTNIRLALCVFEESLKNENKYKR